MEEDSNSNSNSDSDSGGEDFRKEMKKRKQHKESKKTRSKKKKLDVKMELIHEESDKVSPLIGYFPTGYNPHKHLDDEEEDAPPRVRLFRKKDRPNRLQLVVSPEGCKVDFVGSTHSGEAAASQVCTYALGILDKNTHSLKIVPIASNKILRLEPRIVGSDIHDKELLKESAEGQPTEISKKDKMRDLTNLYGSKRSVMKDKRQLTLEQKTDPSTQRDMDLKIKQMKINTEALESAPADTARNIPAYDSTADAPENVYPIDHIIEAEEWDYLLDISKLVHAGKGLSTDAYPSFVSNRMHKLSAIQDEEKTSMLACIFSYITHLIKFKDQKSADHASTAKGHIIPDILYRKFMSMFTDPEKFSIPVDKRDLLISYILVLTLHADGFKTDHTDIAKDLKMSKMKVKDHYISLGCKFTREGKSMLLKLPVPLEFPKPRLGRRRK